jgi:hypothetical protein
MLGEASPANPTYKWKDHIMSIFLVWTETLIVQSATKTLIKLVGKPSDQSMPAPPIHRWCVTNKATDRQQNFDTAEEAMTAFKME